MQYEWRRRRYLPVDVTGKERRTSALASAQWGVDEVISL